MALIRAFKGLRPAPGRAQDVVAPPYDVLSEAEARQRAEGRPWSFLHISRPEIDFPRGVNPYAPEVYARAMANMSRMRSEGVLRQDAEDCYYVYRLNMGTHEQTGLVAAASVAAYDQDRIRKHEFTRPEKEDDRVRQIDALNAQTGPVFLVYRSADAVDSVLGGVAEGFPDVDVTADDGVRHRLWVVNSIETINRLSRAFEAMPALYVADGHHRSAAASRVAADRKARNTAHAGDEPYNFFLAVLFPHDQMNILDYNRVVRDLGGHTAQSFLDAVRLRFDVEQSADAVKPDAPAVFGMYLEGRWYRLRLRPQYLSADDPVARLDVSLLADNLIGPLLGISDPRRDKRIDFVGGIRGTAGLEQRVDSGEMAVAFSLYPTRMEDLMAVADAGEVMPPKSTWFEPKLADGLVSHVLD